MVTINRPATQNNAPVSVKEVLGIYCHLCELHNIVFFVKHVIIIIISIWFYRESSSNYAF